MSKVYENEFLRVDDSVTGDITVSLKHKWSCRVRITPLEDDKGKFIITSSASRLIPWAVDGHSAILVADRSG